MLTYKQRLPLTHPNLSCYYRGPMKARQLGQFPRGGARPFAHRQLGLVPPGSVELASGFISGIKNFFGGLFGKDPNKANYDRAREVIWNEFLNYHGVHGPGIGNRTSTQAEALAAIAGVDEFRRQLTALTDQYRGSIDASWLDPRYHDLYDFMTKVRNDWQSRIPTLPRNGFTGIIGEATKSYLPIVAGLALLFLGRR